MSQIVFRVFRWRDGRYQFNAADAVDYDRENFVPMSADFILMEGIRMVDEWPIIEKKIPSLRHRVPARGRPDADRGGRRRGAGCQRQLLGAGGGHLHRTDSPGCRGGARLPQGRRSRAPCRRSSTATGSGEFEVCRTLVRLPEPQPDRPRRPRQLGRGGGRRGARATSSAVPGYAVAGLVSALALAGLLVQHRAPFAVTGLDGLLPGSPTTSCKDGVLRSRLARLERAIEAWRATHGRPPASLDELVAAGLVQARVPAGPVGAPDPLRGRRPRATG